MPTVHGLIWVESDRGPDRDRGGSDGSGTADPLAYSTFISRAATAPGGNRRARPAGLGRWL